MEPLVELWMEVKYPTNPLVIPLLLSVRLVTETWDLVKLLLADLASPIVTPMDLVFLAPAIMIAVTLMEVNSQDNLTAILKLISA